MLKYLTSSVLAVAITLGAAPSAKAGMDSGELGRLLLGIGAVAVISSQLDSHKRRSTPTTTRRYVSDRDYYQPRVSFHDAKRACRRSDGYGNSYISSRCMSGYGF